MSCEFSVGWAITGRERSAITDISKKVWRTRSTPTAVTVTAPGWLRSPVSSWPGALTGYSGGMRVIVRREHRTRARSSTRSKRPMGGVTPPAQPRA